MYEAHITIAAVQGPRLDRAIELAHINGFKASEEPGYLGSSYSERIARNQGFMTGHSVEYEAISYAMRALVRALQTEQYVVRRYKIEHIVVDSYLEDHYHLLVGAPNDTSL